LTDSVKLSIRRTCFSRQGQTYGQQLCLKSFAAPNVYVSFVDSVGLSGPLLSGDLGHPRVSPAARRLRQRSESRVQAEQLAGSHPEALEE